MLTPLSKNRRGQGLSAVFSLEDLFGQLDAADQVKMQMHDGLAAVFPAVVDDTEAVHQTLLPGDFGNCLKALGYIERVVLIDAPCAADVLLGNHQNVHGRLRIDIPKGKNVIVLIDLCAGDLSGDDPAKDAVLIHFESSLNFFADKAYLIENFMVHCVFSDSFKQFHRLQNDPVSVRNLLKHEAALLDCWYIFLQVLLAQAALERGKMTEKVFLETIVRGDKDFWH